MSTILEVKNLEKSYISENHTTTVLQGLSFSVQKGECLGIVGESGSGKSTLLHILGTLDVPSKGEILIHQQNPFEGSDKQRSLFRNSHMGFVFQQHNLLPEFTALENVMLPALIAGKPKKQVQKRSQELLEKVLLTKRMKHYPNQLSGGEQQRVAIARALVNEPWLVLADEPSGNLDSYNAQIIHELFLQINANEKTTFLIVTHSKELSSLLPRLIQLKDGKLVD